MTDDRQSADSHCALCGAVLRPGAGRCWLCRAPVVAATAAPAAAPAAARTILDRGFSLSSLMLIVTLVGVVLGMFSIAPGFGLVAAIASVPALLRTVSNIRRRKQRGEATTMGEKAVVFAASLGVVVVAGVAAAVAFYAACWGGFLAGAAVGTFWERGNYAGMGTGFITGIALGGVLGLWVFFRIMKALRPSD